MSALMSPPTGHGQLTGQATSLASSDAPAVAMRRRAPAGDIPAIDWQGQPISNETCQACVHSQMRAEFGVENGCEPGYRCVQDVYARRIDRFFRDHRHLAGRHLAHPYFEVRAIAARWADIFQLTPLLNDPDETVRLQVALRVPQRQLLSLCDDPHREVRIRVAQRLEESQLSRLIHDPDYQVRGVLARRLPVALLPLLAADADPQVRCQVAERVDMPCLWRLAQDSAWEVRRIVARRLPPGLLPALAADEDWGVRWQVAERLDSRQHLRQLRELAQDEDSEVRALAQSRLQSASADVTPFNPSGADHGGHCP